MNDAAAARSFFLHSALLAAVAGVIFLGENRVDSMLTVLAVGFALVGSIVCAGFLSRHARRSGRWRLPLLVCLFAHLALAVWAWSKLARLLMAANG